MTHAKLADRVQQSPRAALSRWRFGVPDNSAAGVNLQPTRRRTSPRVREFGFGARWWRDDAKPDGIARQQVGGDGAERGIDRSLVGQY